MKRFYWKALINKITLKNFISLIIATVLTAVSTVNLFKNYGLDIAIQSFLLSWLYDNLKEAKNAIKYVNEQYTIDTKKE